MSSHQYGGAAGRFAGAKGAPSSSFTNSFYSNLVDQAMGPKKPSNYASANVDRFYGGESGRRNLSREDYPASNQASRKRTYTEMRQSCNDSRSNSKGVNKRLRRNNRGGDNPGTDEQAEESGMEDDAGGSSQDQYESDFINDDGREEIEANKARRLKKGQIDSSDEE